MMALKQHGYISAEGSIQKGLPKLTSAEIAALLFEGAEVDWCETLFEVLGLLEVSLGKSSQVASDYWPGWGSYSSSCGYVFHFEKSELVLRALRISDWHGQCLSLLSAAEFEAAEQRKRAREKAMYGLNG